MTTTNLFAAALAAALVAAPAATAVGAPVCGTFEVVAGPDTTGGTATLKGVATLDGTVWAIGDLRKGATASPIPFVARYDGGSTWEYEATPDLSNLGVEATFEGIAVAPNSGTWVVGHYREKSSGLTAPIILRNFRGFWRQMTVEQSGSPRAIALRDVVAVSRTDVWAVGDATAPGSAVATPLALHFDGESWTEVALGDGAPGRLVGVSATADTKAWAVGHEILSTTLQPQTTVARIAQWDGKSWSGIRHPAMRPDTLLNDVVAIAANDVWAVGQDGNAGLFLHYDGTQWAQHSVIPDAAPLSVSAVSGDDVWAVGRDAFYHFDGQSWMTIPATNKPGQSARRAIAVGGPCQAYAVGTFNDGQSEFTLFEKLTDPAEPQAPVAPTAVTATAPSYDKAVVEWQHAGGATGFIVERCDSEAFACDTGSASGYAVIAKVPASAAFYADAAVKPKLYFTYRLRAYNGAGESANSMSVTVLVPAAPEQEPTPEPVPVPVPVPPSTNLPPTVPGTTGGLGQSPDSDPVPAPPSVPQSPQSEPAPAPAPEAGPDVVPVPTPLPPSPETAPAPTKIFIPLPPTTEGGTCVAATAEVVVHRQSSLRAGSALLEVVLKDAQGYIADAGCLPVKWMPVKDSAPVTVQSNRTGKFATVRGEPGIYAIRALAPNGVSVDVVLTLN